LDWGETSATRDSRLPVKIPRCKGTKDLLPQDMSRFRQIEETFRSLCHGWGYQEIRTPTLEYLHLFTSAGTLSPARLSRVYSFLDWDGWSGERVVLRPDGTIPAARLYIEELSHLPLARLFYIENVFSFEGESRESWQCGAELIGSREPQGETELLMLALEILDSLNLQAEIRLSHLGLLRGLISEIGLEREEEVELLQRILRGDGEATSQASSKSPQVAELLRLVLDVRKATHGFLENLKGLLFSTLPHLAGYAADLAQITELLHSSGRAYQADFALGQEFEYYTGIVFQFRVGNEVVGGGGRYDELIPLIGGKEVPASGFALYMDKLVRLLEPPPPAKRILLKSRTTSTESLKSTFETAQMLRSEGWIVELGAGERKTTDFDWVILLDKQGGNLVLDLVRKDGLKWKNLSPDEARRKLRGNDPPT